MTPAERQAYEEMRRGLLMAARGIARLLESAQQANDRPARESVPAATTEPADWPPSRRSERASA